MSSLDGKTESLNRFLAILLRYGTWTACIVIGCGLVLDALNSIGVKGDLAIYSPKFILAGVALLIALPIGRVFSSLVYFTLQREYVYSGFALVVLVIIALGAFLK